MIFVLSDQNTLANQFLVELRDKSVQQDRPRFRRNLERLGEIMAYEISRKLEYKTASIETPLGQTNIQVLNRDPVLITILRAGLPFYQGFQNFFDRSEVGFIGAYRKEGTHITVQLDYVAAPGLSGKEVILIDPMLATGKSVTDAVTAILKNGRPDHIHVAALVAAPEGVAYLGEHLRTPHTLWTFAVDEKLNPQSYIVPGLGDAGDLSYGPKL